MMKITGMISIYKNDNELQRVTGMIKSKIDNNDNINDNDNNDITRSKWRIEKVLQQNIKNIIFRCKGAELLYYHFGAPLTIKIFMNGVRQDPVNFTLGPQVTLDHLNLLIYRSPGSLRSFKHITLGPQVTLDHSNILL